MKKYVIAIDQGTTSSRAIIFDKNQNIVAIEQKEFTQYYPKPGWVEHDPMEILETQMQVLKDAVKVSGIPSQEIGAIGIANQRETVIVWDRKTGKPIYPAIVWQCRRTADLCEELKEQNHTELIRNKTGLLIDAYFSATKVQWILEQVPSARERAEAGELLFGTVDSFLIWHMTNGEVHITDYTNASRTMLFNIHTLKWDDALLNLFHIPKAMMPKVKSSSEIYGYYDLQGAKIPIAGLAGDQQAALFGQACFEKGQGKNTYGTGCFLLVNAGETCPESQNGLLSTIGIGLEGKIQYAVEGSVFVGGAVIQWLRDEMGLLSESSQAGVMAQEVEDNGGIFFVPAFTGLGAPYWDMYARGAILGITRGTKKEHIVRAAVESMAFQTKELLDAIKNAAGIEMKDLKVDGGASRNQFLLQFQADISNLEIHRPKVVETTALGAAYLAGLAVGMWDNLDDIRNSWESDQVCKPCMEKEKREKLILKWEEAVRRACHWADKES